MLPVPLQTHSPAQALCQQVVKEEKPRKDKFRDWLLNYPYKQKKLYPMQ